MGYTATLVRACARPVGFLAIVLIPIVRALRPPPPPRSRRSAILVHVSFAIFSRVLFHVSRLQHRRHLGTLCCRRLIQGAGPFAGVLHSAGVHTLSGSADRIPRPSGFHFAPARPSFVTSSTTPVWNRAPLMHHAQLIGHLPRMIRDRRRRSATSRGARGPDPELALLNAWSDSPFGHACPRTILLNVSWAVVSSPLSRSCGWARPVAGASAPRPSSGPLTRNVSY